GFDVDDSRPAASLQAVFVGGGAFAVAVFGDGENQSAFFRHQVGDLSVGCGRFGGIDFRRNVGLGRSRHANQVVALFHADAPDTVCLAAHGADVFFVEADGLALVRGQEDDLLSVREAGRNQFVALL